MLHLRIVLGGLGQALLVHAHTHVTLMLCMLKPGAPINHKWNCMLAKLVHRKDRGTPNDFAS